MTTFHVLKLGDMLPKNLLKERKLVAVRDSYFTAAGENYGSTVISIVITLQHEYSNKQEEIYTVAKFPPPGEFWRRVTNNSHTFRNELAFYQTIFPTLQCFQKEQNSGKTLEFFPKFLGGRLSLNPLVKFPDEDAIILLENLKEKGFKIHDRYIGFDIYTSKLILKKLAQLHSVTLALKLKKPAEFEHKISPYLEEYEIFTNEDGVFQILVNNLFMALAGDDFCCPYLDRIRSTVNTCLGNFFLPKNTLKFRQDTFATFIHSDLWTNNIMVKTYMNKVQDVKLLDLQLFEYASVTKDLLFFLFTSVESSLLIENLDELITFYYKELKENLEEMKCCDDDFSFNAFTTEMKTVASSIGYFHVIRGFPFIFSATNVLCEGEEFTREHFFKCIEFSKICTARVRLTTRVFIKQGWI
ncbi:hypothetical protein Zmor_010109 [Zophobas morio]|uniref:CHK kinase-like domain-containing protein n=1 Tax=Zophobas morio TaxID=2755281 RepID=A0AA38IJW1_9CUCU|nr:hypothetical protein Zmor_010109 [Zophobas morio]